MDNDPINTISDKKLHFNKNLILCFNSTKKSTKIGIQRRSTDIDENTVHVGLSRYDFKNICQMTEWKDLIHC